MIYVTGDCHSNFSRFNKKALEAAGFEFTSDDYVIVCGDLGLLWKEGKELDFNINTFFGNKPFTLLWVQGNHENYDLICTKYLISEWKGGKVRRISNNIILLERGQVFEIEGKTFFTMGGASSHDYEVILDPSEPEFAARKKKLKHSQYCVLGSEWWPQELPSEEELQEGRNNLSKYNYKVNYVITHCASGTIQKEVFGKNYKLDILNDYFEELENVLNYDHWYFGHYHDDLEIDEQHTCLYQKVVPIEDKGI